MLDSEREAIRTLRREPGLLVGGAVVTLAWLVAQFVAAIPAVFVALPAGTQPAFALLLASVVSLLVVPPALSGLYAVARAGREGEESAGVPGGAGSYFGGCVRHASDLLVATTAFRLVAVVPAAVAFVLLMAGDTALHYALYATGDLGSIHGSIWLLLVVLYAMVAGAVGRLALAFYDLPVLFAGVTPRRGWRAALRVTRRRPRAVVRYGAGRFLLWSPMLVVLGLEGWILIRAPSVTPSPTTLGLFVGAALGLGTVTATLLATHHVVVYERTVEPVLREPTPTGGETPVAPDSPAVATSESDGGGTGRRAVLTVALLVLLVTAAAAGTAAVRVSDTRPIPDATRPVNDTMDGDAVVRNAGRTLEHASYRRRTSEYRVNSSGERRVGIVFEFAFDRVDRRARWSARAGNTTQQYYATEGVLATDTPGIGAPPPEGELVRRQVGEWVLLSVPGYSEVAGGSAVFLPERDDWNLQIVERTDDRIVVGDTRRRDDEPPDDGEVVAAEQVRVTVDPATGRPTRFVENRTVEKYENGSVVERYHLVEETTYGDYGEPEVRRPDAIGPRGPLEWLWDLAYY